VLQEENALRCVPAAVRMLPLAIVAVLAAACNAAAGSPSVPQSVQPPTAVGLDASHGKIQRVVIIVQENRSFNNLFYGFPGARTATYGYDTNGSKIALEPVGLETRWDLDHSSYSFFAACNGTGDYPGTKCRMNGFNKEQWYCGHAQEPPCPNRLPPYSYVPHSETKPYFFMGEHYVLADQMYASNFDASSFVSHQYIIAGRADSAVNYPWNYWGCSGGGGDKVGTVTKQRRYGKNILLCWNDETLGDEMDNAGLSWAYYTSPIKSSSGIWNAYQNIDHIYNGPDWSKDVITPQTAFFKDVKNGSLRDLSWITPTCANSDHAGCDSTTGPAWVASLVNAVGESKYWDSTAIFIFWDDYGGWYDPEPPALVDYDGLGLRIPMLVVSAYAKRGFVDHTHFEHGSILKFVEDTFGLSRLAPSDTRANSPDDAFDFAQSPRKFEVVPSAHDANFFLHQPLDPRPPDEE
jgi:phospholipase C